MTSFRKQWWKTQSSLNPGHIINPTKLTKLDKILLHNEYLFPQDMEAIIPDLKKINIKNIEKEVIKQDLLPKKFNWKRFYVFAAKKFNAKAKAKKQVYMYFSKSW